MTLINFQRSRNRMNNHKGPENIKYIITKYRNTFYNHHMTLTPAVVRKGMTLDRITAFTTYRKYENVKFSALD